MENEKRQIVKIIEEICVDKGYSLSKFSDEWILQITNKKGQNCFIFGYKFPNNNASIAKICDDKSALADVLEKGNIPRVPHIYIEFPNSPLNSDDGIYSKLFEMLDKYGELVCKTNSGSGGSNIYSVKTRKQLESVTFKIFNSSRAIAVSPKIDIQNEYRVIVEDKKALLVYRKVRPYVIGNGKSKISELMIDMNIPKSDMIESLDYSSIPMPGETVTVAWKHNLGQGSKPELIKDDKILKKLIIIALSTAKYLNLNFASIDIICDNNNNYKILEINSGVMMENFSRSSSENYQLSKKIYTSAIESYFSQINK